MVKAVAFFIFVRYVKVPSQLTPSGIRLPSRIKNTEFKFVIGIDDCLEILNKPR